MLVLAAVIALLVAGGLVVAGCSRPTPSAGQATAAPGAPPEGGYPTAEAPVVEPTEGPKEGEPGYPPPNPLDQPTEDPYPGKTETAAAGGARSEATAAPAVTATP